MKITWFFVSLGFFLVTTGIADGDVSGYAHGLSGPEGVSLAPRIFPENYVRVGF